MYIPYLFDLYGAIFKSSVGDWGINSSTIRLRRDDDDFEKEFLSVAGALDVASITDFNSWNLLDGGAYRDYLYDTPLGVDTNLNGVSDGWTYADNGFDGTFLNSVSDDGQKMEITVGGSNDNDAFISVETPVNVGDRLILTVEARVVSGDVRAYVILDELGQGGVVDSTLSSEWTTLIMERTIVAQSEVTSKLRLDPNGIGNVGKIEYRNAKLVKNDFIENIGLLTEDDDLDGVANSWGLFANAQLTTIESVSTQGQEIDVTNATSDGNFEFDTNIYNNVQPSKNYTATAFVKREINIGSGGFIVFQVDTYTSGDVKINSYTSSSIVDGEGTLSISFTSEATTDYFRVFFVQNTLSGSQVTCTIKNATLKQTNNSTYVSKVFDKSGNGNHAVQTVSSEQPRLVNAGVFEVDPISGDYAIYFNGSTYNLDIVDNNGLNLTTYLSVLAQHNPQANVGYVITRNNDTSPNVQYGMLVTNSGIANSTQAYLEGDQRTGDQLTTLNQSRINIFTYDMSNVKMFLDGVLKDTTSFTATLTPRDNAQIGCRSSAPDGSTKTVFYEGHISRIIIFNKALTQNEITYLTSKV